MKKTYRKGFNFFRSYFDVCNELPDKERLQFLDALLNKQFLGIDPEGLKGMAKFAWISQIHSIDSQVKGYETKTGTALYDPTAPPTYGGTPPPTVQVQVQVQEKGEVQGKEKNADAFEIFWNKYPHKVAKQKCNDRFMKLNDEDVNKILSTLNKFISYKPFETYTHPNPDTYLNQKRWNDEIPEPKAKEMDHFTKHVLSQLPEDKRQEILNKNKNK